jgi:hypothetical protein
MTQKSGHTVTAQFPEINRQVILNMMYESASGFNGPAGLGCDTGILSQLFLEADPNTIRVMKPEVEKKDAFTGRTSTETQTAVQTCLKSWRLPQEDRERLYNALLNTYNGRNVVFMRDLVNAHSEVHPNHSQIAHPWAAYDFKTIDFIKWLVKNQHGLVVGSPIHCTGSRHGARIALAQGFVWIPPRNVESMMPDSIFVSAPIKNTWPNWYDFIAKCMGKKAVKPEDLKKRLVRDEKFLWWL